MVHVVASLCACNKLDSVLYRDTKVMEFSLFAPNEYHACKVPHGQVDVCVVEGEDFNIPLKSIMRMWSESMDLYHSRAIQVLSGIETTQSLAVPLTTMVDHLRTHASYTSGPGRTNALGKQFDAALATWAAGNGLNAANIVRVKHSEGVCDFRLWLIAYVFPNTP